MSQFGSSFSLPVLLFAPFWLCYDVAQVERRREVELTPVATTAVSRQAPWRVCMKVLFVEVGRHCAVAQLQIRFALFMGVITILEVLWLGLVAVFEQSRGGLRLRAFGCGLLGLGAGAVFVQARVELHGGRAFSSSCFRTSLPVVVRWVRVFTSEVAAGSEMLN